MIKPAVSYQCAITPNNAFISLQDVAACIFVDRLFGHRFIGKKYIYIVLIILSNFKKCSFNREKP